jgi:hypothetical protein
MRARVLIGSSGEAKRLARAIHELLDDEFDCTPWDQMFSPSSVTIDVLLQAATDHDYGVFILGPDDNLTVREKDYRTPRDNVILESGIFMGRYGRNRTFLVAPRNVPDLHLPSDLLGVTHIEYDAGQLARDRPENIVLGPACTKIRRTIKEQAVGPNGLMIESYPLRTGGAFPLKVMVNITNQANADVLIHNLFCLMGTAIRCAPNARVRRRMGLEAFLLQFRKPYPAQATDPHIMSSTLVRSGDRVDSFVGLDPTQTDEEVARAVKKKEVGGLHLTCYWLRDDISVENYLINI